MQLIISLLKLLILVVNIDRSINIYNFKYLLNINSVIILLCINKPAATLLATLITILNVSANKKRKKVYNQVEASMDSEKYKNLKEFFKQNNLDSKSFSELLKQERLKKTELYSSVIILLACIFGLLFSPFIAMIFTLISYLGCSILKGLVKISLEKPYIYTVLFTNAETELRLGNERTINNIIKKIDR